MELSSRDLQTILDLASGLQDARNENEALRNKLAQIEMRSQHDLDAAMLLATALRDLLDYVAISNIADGAAVDRARGRLAMGLQQIGVAEG